MNVYTSYKSTKLFRLGEGFGLELSLYYASIYVSHPNLGGEKVYNATTIVLLFWNIILVSREVKYI